MKTVLAKPLHTTVRLESFVVWLVAILLVVSICFPMVSSASIAVSPARFQVHAGPDGQVVDLHFLNKSDSPYLVTVYPGLGDHRLDGSPIYFDDPATVAQTRRWVIPERSSFLLESSEHQVLPVTILPQGNGSVSAYPVIFAEFQPAEQIPDLSPRARARLAILGLVTFPSERAPTVIGEVLSLTAYVRPSEEEAEEDQAVGESEIAVDIVARNAGNVHGMIGGRIHAVDAFGRVVSTTAIESQRVLPGSARILSGRLNLHEAMNGSARGNSLPKADSVSVDGDLTAAGHSRDGVRLVAVLEGEGWSSSYAPLALTLPQFDGRASAIWPLRYIGARLDPSQGRIVVEAEWSALHGTSDSLVAQIDVFDATGELLADYQSQVLEDEPGIWRLETALPIERHWRPAALSMQLYEGEVSRAYAATSLLPLEGQQLAGFDGAQ